MGYYVRILSPEAKCIPARAIREALSEYPELDVTFEEPDAEWENAIVGRKPDPDAEAVLELERNPVESNSLGQEEVEEFLEELADAEPTAGAAWVREYLEKVRTIYAVRFLSLESDHPGVATSVIEAIKGAAGGIIQADAEGFSNEEGHGVVWQFSDHASGPWTMALPRADGSWRTFEMDLDNPSHQEAFLRGEVPEGARPVPK